MYIQRKEIMTTEELLKELTETSYQFIVEKIEEWKEDVDITTLPLEELANEIAIALCFSFSSLLNDYLMANYELVEEDEESYGPSFDDMDEFTDEVVMCESPFDHALVEDDETLQEIILACAKKIKGLL